MHMFTRIGVFILVLCFPKFGSSMWIRISD